MRWSWAKNDYDELAQRHSPPIYNFNLKQHLKDRVNDAKLIGGGVIRLNDDKSSTIDGHSERL